MQFQNCNKNIQRSDSSKCFCMKISSWKDLMQIKTSIFHLHEYRLQANKTHEVQVQHASSVLLSNLSYSALIQSILTRHLHQLNPELISQKSMLQFYLFLVLFLKNYPFNYLVSNFSSNILVLILCALWSYSSFCNHLQVIQKRSKSQIE